MGNRIKCRMAHRVMNKVEADLHQVADDLAPHLVEVKIDNRATSAVVEYFDWDFKMSSPSYRADIAAEAIAEQTGMPVGTFEIVKPDLSYGVGTYHVVAINDETTELLERAREAREKVREMQRWVGARRWYGVDKDRAEAFARRSHEVMGTPITRTATPV